MSKKDKKDKKISSLAVDSQEVIAMLPKLKNLLKTYIEISKGYRVYRENGGDMISGIEEHLGIKEQLLEHSKKTKTTEILENKEPEKDTKEKKANKKDTNLK